MQVRVTERTRKIGIVIAVGVFFGFYPARKVGALDPKDAFRYA